LSYLKYVPNEISNIALRYVQRRVLLFSLVPLGLLFALTVTLARTYHAREEGLVQEWFQQGNQDLAGGQPAKALEDFRNALSYAPDNDKVQLRLAEALLADGQLDEARSYFVNLWDRSPGSGEVNLDLAHLSMRTNDVEDAIRYFRSAIYGSWEKDPTQQRQNTRLELCEFLISQGRSADAQAELAGLAADTPPEDAVLHVETGRLFLKTGEPGKALAEFEAALRINRRNSQWLELAGKASFATGDYPKAEAYLARAVREKPSEADEALLGTVRALLSNDPFRAGLSDDEQARRVWRAFQYGNERIQKCTEANTKSQSNGQAPSDLQALAHDAQGLKKRITLRTLGNHPELRNEAMQFVFRIENVTAQSCGAPTSMDQAMILIEKRQAGSNP